VIEAEAQPVFPNYTEMQPHVPVAVWQTLRVISVIIALGVSVLLFVAPQAGLLFFWGLFIPLVPLIFFVAPGSWRNICPMAALNQTPRIFGFSRGLPLPGWLKEHNYLIGISLLFLIIPTRKVLFNHNGLMTALLVLGALTLAFVGGLLFKGKSGWCSSICPLLPAQRLYGQAPFLIVRNSYCQPCVGCAKNCYDFNPTIAYLADQYDEDRRYSNYRRFFAGAFPGLILAFYTLPDPPIITVLDLYLQFGLYILASVGSFFALDSFLKLTPIKLPSLYGVAALNLYYWFNLPLLAERLGRLLGVSIPVGLIWVVQLALLGLTLIWLVRTYRREGLFAAQALLATPLRVGSRPARTIQLNSQEGRPEVTFMPDEKRVRVEPGRTLLETVESAGLLIEVGCRMGVCGADPVAILAGMENLSPIGREEWITLERLGLAENTRMACRARIQGPVSVSLTPEGGQTAALTVMTDFKYDPTVTRVVILGTGIAGVTAADHVRRRHPECEIHLVGREKHYLYNRMGILRLIYGRSATQGLYLLPESWYDQHRITCWINTQVTQLDREHRQVILATGETLSYDRLILALGSSSFVPPLEGFDLAGTFVLREADDAMRIRAFVQENSCRHAVIAGGGLLGLEAAYAIHKLGVSVTILERSERLLSRQLDRRGAQILQDYLERMGLEIVLKAETASVLGEDQFVELFLEKPELKDFFGSRAQGHGRVTQVLLKDGRLIPCDLFLVAVGIKPNVGLAQQAGLQINRGVVVDSTMRSSDPNVFAIGDLAEYQGQIIGLWPPAVEQAEVAAINSIGGDAVYLGSVPVTMLKVVGIDLMSIGRFEPASGDEVVLVLEDMVADSEERHYRKLVIADGKIVGAILIGYPIDAPVVVEMVKQQAGVTPYLDALRAGDWSILHQIVAKLMV
jgi:NADPH-dependent 2,4-dienoyl-CoA reductase/sulfur reductase-like enzyme/ferredoxin